MCCISDDIKYYIRLTNVTFSDIDWQSSTGKLNVFWYMDAYVNDTNGADLQNVNVTAWDNNSNQVFTELTNSSGWITRQIVQEYWQNATETYYYTNYTVNATRNGFSKNTTQVNLTTNRVIYFILSNNCCYSSSE